MCCLQSVCEQKLQTAVSPWRFHDTIFRPGNADTLLHIDLKSSYAMQYIVFAILTKNQIGNQNIGQLVVERKPAM